jgi:hypothetical protein
LKEINNSRKWKLSHLHGFEDNTTKLVILTKATHRVNAISTTTPGYFFEDIGKPIAKFI